MKEWFCFDGDGMVYFDTEAEALRWARQSIDSCCDETWCEEVVNIVVGRVTHHAKQTNVVERADMDVDEEGYDRDGNYWPIGMAYTCDYEMQPVEGSPTA